jgi:hypothetical protein
VTSPTATVPTPAAPTNLTANVSSSAVSLKRTDSSSNEDGFKVEKIDPKGVWTVIATLPAGTQIYNDSGLAAKTTYSYRVGAFINKGGTAYSNTITVTTP